MMKALLVEDDFLARKLMKKLLDNFGECDVAKDGLEALQAFKMAHENGSPYELICLDIMLPGMNGDKVLQEIRKYETELDIGGLDKSKVIMTTAKDDSRTIMKTFKKGCQAYIVKPVDGEVFKKKVFELLRLNISL